MSFKEINLNSLLQILGAGPTQTTSLLRADLRLERKKADGDPSGGGHFHLPFWSDAKAHVIGVVDLRTQTILRSEQLRQRRRLYPILSDGFLRWFSDLKRQTNQNVGWKESNPHNRFEFPGLDLTIKVEGLLGLELGQERSLLVYPYFSETPVLSEKWGRIGLWIMSSALPDFDLTDMHVLDVIRGRSFSGASTFLKGDEEFAFLERWEQLREEWLALRPHYGLA